MSRSLKKRFIVALFKFVLITIPLIAVVFLFFRGNPLIRNAMVIAVLAGGYLTVRRHGKSNTDTYSDIGYWSGLDDFEIGIDECLRDLDLLDDDFDVYTDEHYTEKTV